MREVQASEAKTHLPQLLDAVERGETIVITRHGRSIARLVPEHRVRQEQIEAAAAGLRGLRESIKARGERLFSLDEIKAYRDEGRS
jgi:prevent-host-death family protein